MGRSTVWSGAWMVGAACALACVLAGPIARAQGRGALAVLELRAPGGDDAAATGMTRTLRRVARTAGFEVPDTGPSLEQLVASLGCDDAVPASCLSQIAADQHLARFVYGSVRRAARGSSTLRVEIRVYDRSRASAPQSFEVDATTAEAGQGEGPAREAFDALLPAPSQQEPVATPAGPRSTPAPAPRVTPAPTSARRPTPVLRYAGFATMGVGAVTAIVGAVFGVQWIGFNSEQQTRSAWAGYQPMVSDPTNSTMVCDAARGDTTQAGRDAASVCDQNSALLTAEGALLTAGGVLMAAGLVMVLVDRTPSGATESAPGGPIAARERGGVRLNGVAPVITRGQLGAVLEVGF